MSKFGFRTEVLLHRYALNRGPGMVSTDNELYLQRNYVGKLSLSVRGRLGDTVQLIFRLGGYHARKRGPATGLEVIWHGQM